MSNHPKYLKLFSSRDTICVSHYPVPISHHSQDEIKDFMKLNEPTSSNKKVALYVHIPFCDSICSFCPFNKYQKQQQLVDTYLKHLLKEIDMYSSSEYGKTIVVSSINFGGGTPTSLSLNEIASVLEHIKSKFKVESDAMIFVEGNPKNFTLQKLEKLYSLGMNRISVGVQTFQKKVADYLNLYHSIQDSYNLVKNARDVGIENIGIDLMYNTPGQTLEDWEKDISVAIKLQIDHICLISFCVVPHTSIASEIEKKNIPNINDTFYEINLYEKAKKILIEAGYEQYSVIDFSLQNKTDKHAEMYFGKQSDLIGVGAAAFGYLNDYMYVNNGNIKEYCQELDNGCFPINCGEKANYQEKAHGYMAKALRMLSVDCNDFFNLFGKSPAEYFEGKIKNLKDLGLIDVTDRYISLTNDGIVWGNNVCKEFFSDKYKKYGLNTRVKLAKGKEI